VVARVCARVRVAVGKVACHGTGHHSANLVKRRLWQRGEGRMASVPIIQVDAAQLCPPNDGSIFDQRKLV
jgi:hypothetical protein